MRPLIRTIPVLMALAFNAVAGSVGAQPLGTFRWQQLPYCNVLTVNVVQSGGVFHLDGTDDQCGVPVLAAVVGLAFQNPDGTIGLGMTIVTTPGATPLHLDATVSLPSASGTWRDSSGATGSFVLTSGPSAGGSARPVPRTAFPGGLSVGGTTITNVAAPVAGTDAANKAYVDVADAASRAALVNAKVWSAYVGSGGAKNSPGRYTSARTGTGAYTVIFDLTGLGVRYNGFPAFVATPVACTGGSVQLSSGVGTIIGGFITTINLSVAVTNAAGTATDCQFFMLLHPGEPNAPDSPVPPLDTDRAPACTTIGDETICVLGQ